jgi:hypothetical protein
LNVTTSTDWFARGVALAGLIVGVPSAIVAMVVALRGRHRVIVQFEPTPIGIPASDENGDVVRIKVTNLGRPMAVNDIFFEWADDRPEPMYLDWRRPPEVKPGPFLPAEFVTMMGNPGPKTSPPP